MTHAEEIARAVSSLIEKGCLPFRRVDVRDELGLSHDKWMSGYTAIFQGMRIDHPGGAPGVDSKYKDVFKRVNRGKYILTEKGKKIILRARASIYLPGIPDNIKKKILEQMNRPEGTFSFRGAYDRLWDESRKRGILLQIITGKTVYRLERDEKFNINFYLASPETGTRIATVDAKPLKGISRLRFTLTWSPENINLYIGSLEGESIFLKSTSRKAETSLHVGEDGALYEAGDFQATNGGDKIDQPFAEEMKEYKISKEQIRQTVESPDKTNRFDLHEVERDLRGIYPSGRNLFVNIHLKKFVESGKEIYLLILTREPEGGSVHVSYGYKLTSDLMPSIDKDPPIDVLRGFFERFGNPMIVDGDERKFVRAAMYLADENDIPIISIGRSPKGHRFTLQQFAKFSPRKYAVVMLQGSLNVTRYLEWLDTSKLI